MGFFHDIPSIYIYIYFPQIKHSISLQKEPLTMRGWKTFEPGPRYLFIPLLLMLVFGQNPSNSLECDDSKKLRDAQDPQVAGKL